MNKTFKIFIYFVLMSSFISYIVIKNSLTSLKLNQLDSTLIENLVNTFVYTDEINKNKPNTGQIFCIILTSAESLEYKAKVIYDTWAHRCDNYKFISTVSDEIRNGNDTRYKVSEDGTEFHYQFDILQPPGLINDTYSELTDKVFKTIKHLYNKYSGYDWYLKADDDTYIFMDNLRKFVSDKNPFSPVTYGFDFRFYVKHGYHSGGGGYLLSNEAFKRLGSKLNENYKFCSDDFIALGVEDVDVARCLRKLEVYPNKSIDDMGRERFHPFSILEHYNGYFPEWFHRYASNPIQTGLNCCSDSTISFHYMSNEEIVYLDNIWKDLSIEESRSSNKTSNAISFKDIIKKCCESYLIIS